MAYDDDRLVFGPGDVDLARSPLRRSLAAKTHVLGAFNPGLTRLPNGKASLSLAISITPADGSPDQAITATT